MIGITERGDASLNDSWIKWVKNDKKPTILITKSPSRLIEKILKPNELLYKNPNFIIHCTITGLGGTVYEPNVKDFKEELDSLIELSKKLGEKHIVLRIDPILPYNIEPALEVLNEARKLDFNGRYRISFLDFYKHVVERFLKNGIEIPKIYKKDGVYNLHAPLYLRRSIVKKYFSMAEICGEPDLYCTGCVSELDCKTLKVIPNEKKSQQRLSCMCLAMKKELLNNKSPCFHNCIYCYWKDKNF